ncbi:phosphotransferase [Propionicimonas sp. T2.31MG-18]|uniref:phosphotransferase n=1 Tax=Propionicimonas sp. T2.31MG-18 TaxID=3157620 RepID=UPI00366E8C0C
MNDLIAAAELLQSPEAIGLLVAALTGSPLAELEGFSADLTNWQYRPGAEVTAGYQVGYPTPGGQVVEHLFATTAEVGSPAVTLSRGDLRFGVWRHPDDPMLPGLAAACDPETVLGWLDTTPTAIDLALIGYRPLRRAVLRVNADGAVCYLKVLSPARADRLAARQELLAANGLTPQGTSRPTAGVLLTPAAAGRPLASLLAGSSDPDLPTPGALVGLLDRLPAGLLLLPRRPSWADRLDFHAAAAVQRLPGSADRLARLVHRVRRVLETAPVGPVVPTHGDFYEANIMVEGPSLQLIDLDAAGPGLREDDLACLLAHLAVLPGLSPAHYGGVDDIVSTWTGELARRVDPAALTARVAAVLVSLVAGGEGDQAEHRLDLAEAWAGRPAMREP